MIDALAKQIEAIALENPDGFTLNVRNLELLKSGIAVAYEATQNQVGFGGLYTCLQHSLYHDGFIGGWRNPEGRMQYDSIRIFHSLGAAVKWGRKQKQYAIYDLDNGWEVVL